MTQVHTECVLVVPTELFHRLGYFQGFTDQIERYLPELLSARHTSYRPRTRWKRTPASSS